MTNKQINSAATEHAREVLGEEQFAKNKAAVKSIESDFKAGVRFCAALNLIKIKK